MTVMDAKIKSTLPYYGGKRTMASEIVRELGPHKMYVEPCCGSLAVLFAKPPCAIETVNDLHGAVINLTMVLASDRWNDLYELVDRILLGETLIPSFQREIIEEIEPPEAPYGVDIHHIELAAHYMALSWIGRNGHSGSKRTNMQIAVRWKQGGGSPGIRWRSAVDSVPAWHDRLKGVTILNRDLFDILPKLSDEDGTAIYVDPPYIEQGSKYKHKFCPEDHERLAIELRRFNKARVVVSYYDHERLDDLYVKHKPWVKVDHTRNKNLHVQYRRGASREDAPEVLLLNGPSIANKKGLFEAA